MTRRNKIIRWLAVTLLIAGFVHYVGIAIFPRVMMGIVGTFVVSSPEPNILQHAPRATAENQKVVRSSPDLLYSWCAFDLSEGPLRVTAPPTGAYMSVSCYDNTTTCIYVRNDQQVGASGFDLVLVGPGDEPPEIAETDIVRSPSNWGVVLFRNFAGNGSQVEAIETARHQATSTVL